MNNETSHILYEWEACYQATLPGGHISRSYEERSQIIHRLDTPAKFRIPENAVTTPVRYDYYQERWYLTNGKPLVLPHRAYLFRQEEQQ